MPTWPSEVPFEAVTGSYSRTRQDAVTRTAMDAGPGKARRRFTAVPVDISFSLQPLSYVQFAALQAFFVFDLQEGALPFSAVHPAEGVVKNFRFRAPFSERHSGELVIVGLELEELP